MKPQASTTFQPSASFGVVVMNKIASSVEYIDAYPISGLMVGYWFSNPSAICLPDVHQRARTGSRINLGYDLSVAQYYLLIFSTSFPRSAVLLLSLPNRWLLRDFPSRLLNNYRLLFFWQLGSCAYHAAYFSALLRSGPLFLASLRLLGLPHSPENFVKYERHLTLPLFAAYQTITNLVLVRVSTSVPHTQFASNFHLLWTLYISTS